LLRKGRSLRWVSREGTLCLLCLHHEDIIKQLQLVRTLLIVTHSASLPWPCPWHFALSRRGASHQEGSRIFLYQWLQQRCRCAEESSFSFCRRSSMPFESSRLWTFHMPSQTEWELPLRSSTAHQSPGRHTLTSSSLFMIFFILARGSFWSLNISRLSEWLVDKQYLLAFSRYLPWSRWVLHSLGLYVRCTSHQATWSSYRLDLRLTWGNMWWAGAIGPPPYIAGYPGYMPGGGGIPSWCPPSITF
jgi:hypothetical protein